MDLSTGRAPSARWLVLAPLAVLAAMGALVVGVWRQQVRHERLLLARHADDVCLQATRRAEVFLAGRFALAELFAERWTGREAGEVDRTVFEQAALLVVAEEQGFHGVALVPPGASAAWVAPVHNQTLPAYVAGQGQALLEAASRSEQVVLSPPENDGAPARVYAALAMRRDGRSLGCLIFELQAAALFNELYHARIRSEFAFRVEDEGATVFRFAPDQRAAAVPHAAVQSARTFPVQNRSWRMTVVPRPGALVRPAWYASLALPASGLLLSICLAGMTYLLLARVRDHRRARDEAVREMAQRRRAEEERRASERRYRRVFDSASEGMLVLDLEGAIQEANDAACIMHGYGPGGLKGMNIRQLVTDDHQHKLDEFLETLVSDGSVRIESVDQAKDGRRIVVEVRGTRFMHDGKPAALTILVDVTAHKAALRQQLRLSRQVLVAQEEERERLSRDLHDGLGQTLTALRFEVDWLKKLAGNGAGTPPAAFEQAADLVESSARELRLICKGLRPPLLDDLGLVPAVTQLVDEFRDRAGLEIDLDVELDEDELTISSEVALCTYRVLQEALTNVARHAHARRVDISLVGDGQGLKLRVHDDGRGFQLRDPSSYSRFGIAGMRERAKLVQGEVELSSSTGGKGTRVVLRVPRVEVGLSAVASASEREACAEETP